VNSLFAKILLWFAATLLVVLATFTVSTAMLLSDDEDRQPPYAQLINLQFSEAKHAYETGGRGRLAETLDRFSRTVPNRGVAADGSGRDLVTGEDRSDLMRQAARPRAERLRDERRVFFRRSEDGNFWYFVEVPRRRSAFWFVGWRHLGIVALVALLCYALARHLTYPLRKLQAAVDRFGKGDLKARAGSQRRDELGQLAQTFDRMADRIEILLSAERRLLLDVSHELRSPLARLNVAVELARSGSDPESALNRIQKEADRLNTLVGELLQVTRAEGDPAAMRGEPVRLDELLREVVEDASIEANSRHCRVELQNAPPVTIHADRELVRRAVENVIRNAIRYAPERTAVEVSLKDGPCVVVRDYGPGVPPDSLPRLFDAFYRVEDDRGRASGGVGLGLAIARRAVEIHKGTIRAENAIPGLRVEMCFRLAGAGLQ
jgi:two-component system sensor histidine kinase CpxA